MQKVCMNFTKLILLVLIIFFSACNAKDNFYDKDGGEIVDLDEGYLNDRDAQERPDDYKGPGGGGITVDENGGYDDSEQNDAEEKDDVDDYSDNEDTVDEDDVFEGLYHTEPDVSKCDPGDLSAYDKNKVLDRVNYIRSLHKLLPVTYYPEDDKYTAECSLVIAANRKLSHFPDNSWKCYSDAGREGCSKSNIYIRFGMISSLESESVADAFMTDEGVPSLGHRRWLIDPWLDRISYGRVDDYSTQTVGAAIKVNNETQQNISGTDISFVAYPFEEYPAELYNDEVMMSFTVINNRNNKWQNNTVNFTGAAVSIKDPSNKIMKITGILHDTEGYGVPNNLRWFVEGIKKNVRYDVVITNVIAGGTSKDYIYWFELK